ncbi:MAG: hypothetical protein AAF962_15170 [Actinomycetota bacterium]
MGLLDDGNILRGRFRRDADVEDPITVDDGSARLFGILALVLGLLWIWGLGSLIGLILGIAARSTAQRTFTRRLALVAIVVCIVGMVLALTTG